VSTETSKIKIKVTKVCWSPAYINIPAVFIFMCVFQGFLAHTHIKQADYLYFGAMSLEKKEKNPAKT